MQNYYKLVLHLGWWKQYGKGVPNEIMYSNDSVHRKRERFPLLLSNCFENQCISYTYKQRVLRAESIYIARLKKTLANHRGCGNCSSTCSTRKYFYINKLVFQIYQTNRLKVVNNPIKLYQYIYISLCVCIYSLGVIPRLDNFAVLAENGRVTDMFTDIECSSSSRHWTLEYIYCRHVVCIGSTYVITAESVCYMYTKIQFTQDSWCIIYIGAVSCPRKSAEIKENTI